MKTRIVVFAFGLAVLALPLFGGPQNEKAPRVINISYVESPFNLQVMVMKEKRMLETAYAEKGIEVRWHDINSGAEQTQAMAGGSLDIATVINSTSVILANAAGNPIHIAALVSRPKQSFALMVGVNGPRSIRELKGKTIGGPKGTVLHQMLVAALVKEGMSIGDLNFIQMGLPEARTALLAGRIDGALQAASLIIRDQEAGLRILFTADGYLTPLLFTAVRPQLAKQYPELVKIYLDTQTAAYDWIAVNRREAVAIGARYQQISEADGMKLFQWGGIASVLDREDLRAIQADVDFLYANGMIDRKINPESIILPAAYGE
jgi:NitT/TauT family transport system substrate-binding protein/sulfonate transport system substrate-binding protein